MCNSLTSYTYDVNNVLAVSPHDKGKAEPKTFFSKGGLV